MRAGLRSDTVVFVRIAERDTAITKRVLDIGADGVVIPWIETVSELEAAISDCRYPPEGRRGLGGERATEWGRRLLEHASEANDNLMVIPMIESVAAIPNVSAMCELITGRHHQIRVQFAHRGHPLLGDLRYGATVPFPNRAIALYAAAVAIKHPTRDERMVFEAPCKW